MRTANQWHIIRNGITEGDESMITEYEFIRLMEKFERKFKKAEKRMTKIERMLKELNERIAVTEAKWFHAHQ